MFGLKFDLLLIIALCYNGNDYIGASGENIDMTAVRSWKGDIDDIFLIAQRTMEVLNKIDSSKDIRQKVLQVLSNVLNVTDVEYVNGANGTNTLLTLVNDITHIFDNVNQGEEDAEILSRFKDRLNVHREQFSLNSPPIALGSLGPLIQLGNMGYHLWLEVTGNESLSKTISAVKDTLETFLYDQQKVKNSAKVVDIVRNAYELAELTVDLENVTKWLKSNSTQATFHNDPLLKVIPRIANVSMTCRREIWGTILSIIREDTWGRKLVDASGKLGPGVLQGDIYLMGSYDECATVEGSATTSVQPADLMKYYHHEATNVKRFRTSTCTVWYTVPKNLLGSLTKVDINTPRPIYLRYDVCSPRDCSLDDISTLFNLDVLLRYNITIDHVGCQREDILAEDPTAIAAIVILTIVGLFTVLGTLYGFMDTDDKKTSTGKVDTMSHDKQLPLPKEPELVRDANGTPVNHISHVITHGDVSVDPVTMIELPEIVIKEVPENGTLIIESAGMTQHVHANKSPRPTQKEQKDRIQSQESLFGRILKAMSFINNGAKILNTDQRSSNLSCINGIRAISMTWIIIGHSYSFLTVNYNVANLSKMRELFHDFTFQAILSSTFAVDTFFLLSGILVAYLFLKDTENRGKVSWPQMALFYFHRIWRLTPLYMSVLLIYATLVKYFGNGGMWTDDFVDIQNCRSNWWTNLLYINNVYKTREQCMGWSWFLSNDMQFYVISPLVLVPLFYFPIAGFSLIFLLIITQMASSAYIESSVLNGATEWDGFDYVNILYIKPYCRVGVYAVGMALGYHLLKRKADTSLRKPMRMVCWLLAIAVALLLIYLPYTENRKDGVPWLIAERATFEAISRILWALAVGWVIYACTVGHGGLVNSILSWTAWMPISRLTYATYLIHPIVIMIRYQSQRELLYLSTMSMIFNIIATIIVTYGVAFVVSAVFESPFMAFEKIMLRKK